MYKAINSTLATIIPKHDSPCLVGDFKVMARRLGRVLGSNVHLSQAAFVPRQHLQDHVLLAYELIRGYIVKGGAPKCMLHMDIQKTYDSEEWRSI